jgi:steroid delta-isomerase-like uncharacterized protein
VLVIKYLSGEAEMLTKDRNSEIDTVIDDHFAAEVAGDLPALLATFTDDVEHDVVGDGEPRHGRDEVAGFYQRLLGDLTLERIDTVRRYHGPDFAVDESVVHARAVGNPFGFEGRNRALTFRLLHVFEITDGQIRRENAWLDVPAIISQLA